MAIAGIEQGISQYHGVSRCPKTEPEHEELLDEPAWFLLGKPTAYCRSGRKYACQRF